MFRAKRQGNELSINTIIIMALALIVLAVVAFLFIRSIVKFNDATDCEKQGGKCNALGTPCGEDYPVFSSYTCPTEAKPKCCMDIAGLGQKD